MTTGRELRVGCVSVDGIPHYQIGYWRKRGPLFVPSGSSVVVDGRDLGDLITTLQATHTTMGLLWRQQ